jgi:hypothetical protein
MLYVSHQNHADYTKDMYLQKEDNEIGYFGFTVNLGQGFV